MAGVANRSQQLQEEWPVALFENSFFGTHAEDDFLLAAEGFRLRAHAGASELQAAPAEGKLGSREHGDLAVGKDALDAGDRLREPFKRSGLVGGVYQTRGHVAAVGAVHFAQGIVALIEFKQ